VVGPSAPGAGKIADDGGAVATYIPATDEALAEDALGGSVAPDRETKPGDKKLLRAARRPKCRAKGAASCSGVALRPRLSGYQDHAGTPSASAQGWFA
jgi:hypothetical protein